LSTILTSDPVQAPDPTKGVFGEGSIYCLCYKDHKVNNEFFMASDQKSAEAVGRKYCEVYKKRFIWVSPWLVDLNKAITAKLEGSNT
jgi:hypothetical protein